jgi:hypothetical protein
VLEMVNFSESLKVEVMEKMRERGNSDQDPIEE